MRRLGLKKMKLGLGAKLGLRSPRSSAPMLKGLSASPARLKGVNIKPVGLKEFGGGKALALKAPKVRSPTLRSPKTKSPGVGGKKARLEAFPHDIKPSLGEGGKVKVKPFPEFKDPIFGVRYPTPEEREKLKESEEAWDTFTEGKDESELYWWEYWRRRLTGEPMPWEE